jgi:hypothetical protein
VVVRYGSEAALMQIGLALLAMSVVESMLWIALAILFRMKGMHRRFGTMAAYVTLRAVADPLLIGLLSLNHLAWGRAHHVAAVYFYGYFAIRLAGAILLYCVCMEVLRSALAPIPGILKFSMAIFRWIAVISAIASLSSFTYYAYTHHGGYLIADLCYGTMRAASVVALCLLIFLCLSMTALRLTPRDMAFGIALGFGVMSAGDFILSSWASRISTVNDPVEFAYEALILATLMVWLVYCILPQPERKPVFLPASSALFRWNEIATALGHTGTKVALQQPGDKFFLSDVEHVVDKVLNRSMKEEKSET